MSARYIFPACEFSNKSAGDDLLLKISLLEAAKYCEPSYIGYVQLTPEDIEQLREEGLKRSEMNRNRLGSRWNAAGKKIYGCDMTTDEIGRVCEGAIERIIPLTAQAVVKGIDLNPDLIIGTPRPKRFDIKSSFERGENTFSVSKYCDGRYDAIVFVQLSKDGKAHIWAGKADSRGWELRQGNQGRPDYFLVRCPAKSEKVMH